MNFITPTRREFQRQLGRIDYDDLSRIESVSTINTAFGKLKLVGHIDMPKDELHVLSAEGRVLGRFQF